MSKQDTCFPNSPKGTTNTQQMPSNYNDEQNLTTIFLTNKTQKPDNLTINFLYAQFVIYTVMINKFYGK